VVVPWAIDIETAAHGLASLAALLRRYSSMSSKESLAHDAYPSTEDQDDRPHACNDGWITLGQIVVDHETGEETEEYALYLCRRCMEAGRS
jgi:hypothetical protein